MNKKTTISIGIPAYNEEKTIHKLLKALLAQSLSGFTLQEIIVFSDGSTDKTVKKAKSVSDKKVRIIDQSAREGKSACMQKIINIFKGDILILIDADVTILDKHLLQKVIENANMKKTGLVTVTATPLNAASVFARGVIAGVDVVNEVSKYWNDGNNYLSFRGCFMAMSREFAKNISIPASLVNNDAYVYFMAKKRGYSPRYLTNAEVYYYPPLDFVDHIKQSSRYQGSFNELEQYFGKKIKDEYQIPREILLLAMIKVFFKEPIAFIGYLLIRFMSKIFRSKRLTSTWAIAHSTKNTTL